MLHGTLTMEPRISIITLGVENISRSYDFYHLGLGFPTKGTADSPWIAFQTGGVCLALYPYKSLAEDAGTEPTAMKGQFTGITLAHNTRTKVEVDEIIDQAERAGARVVRATMKPWNIYSGYFIDPDGYYWEVAWGPDWKFHDDGRLVIT